ncbi:MAG: protein translocase subunit SecF [Candidatus Komeilibacteria bacterium CG_4_10_14_0_2_um_filter_37_10]|uniref:Protein-export membrane protein SecF n=1 Tax=Candidatus Komeilibacteria bacterium CG_4_10_14_0_2_um_filter_37_10 TaxID=1974470 RepID=A0A2M7VDK7_9BACT|nr:MAG: protein translocase subunit SecF [Candidatus Komeilibacteria bacterium CG_4_10_14_0_2_um_filter_37_10]
MIKIVEKSKHWFGFSLILIIISIFSLTNWGLNFGIDFTGGSILEIKFSQEQQISTDQVNEILQEAQINNAQIQISSENTVLIRTESIDETKHQELLSVFTKKYNQENAWSEVRFESLGPTLGAELQSKALLAIFLVSLAIIIYIGIAFRKVSYPVQSWKFGLSAVIALIHDVFITIGLFSVLGHFYGYQVDSLFVTAMLTLMGFSVHDTIVTFDRVRENLQRYQNYTFSEIINSSINETIVRSLNTSLTTMIVLLAVYLFGGESIKHFSLALLFGIAIGTYSSIFVASPLLILWYRWQK